MEKWFSLAELEKLSLPGLPKSRKGLEKRAKCDGWAGRLREKSGGGQEFPTAALPIEARKALARKNTLPAPVPAPVQNVTRAKDWQKDIMTARAIICAEIDRLRLEGGITRAAAVELLVEMERDGSLPDWLTRAAGQANARRRAGEPALSRPTLFRWLAVRGDRRAEALLPRPAKEKDNYPWARALLKEWRISSQPSLAACIEEKLPALLPEGCPMPSVSAARRFLDKLPFSERMKGRVGPKEMLANQAYIARDTSELEAGWVYIGDGHTFKSQVTHPIHKRPFRPEVTTILDVATRRAVGWSVSLSENTLAVAEALRESCRGSVPAIFYYDNGSGANNRIWDEPATGLIARLGITKTNSIAGRSQSRGIIERFHGAVLHKAAKWLPGYVGKDMDPDARFLADRAMKRDIRATGTTDKILTWAEFIAYLGEVYQRYNNRPHSGLPKITDSSGKRRHMNPNELWAQQVANGTELFPLTDEEAEMTFRPTERCTVSRCIVRLLTNEYFSLALDPYHKCDVQVSYDVKDGSRVWVSDIEGRFICEAKADANRMPYMPKSAVRIDLEKRAKGRRKLLTNKLDLVDLELNETIDAEFSVVQPIPSIGYDADAADRALAQIAPAPLPTPVPAPETSNERPKFLNDLDWVSWLIANEDRIEDADRTALADSMRAPSFVFEMEMAGIAATTLAKIVHNRKAA